MFFFHVSEYFAVFFHVSEDFAVFFFFQVRPLLPTYRLHEDVCVGVFPYANQIVLAKQNCFTVSYALPMNCSQSQLFVTTVYPLINYVLEGDVHITNIINILYIYTSDDRSLLFV